MQSINYRSPRVHRRVLLTRCSKNIQVGSLRCGSRSCCQMMTEQSGGGTGIPIAQFTTRSSDCGRYCARLHTVDEGLLNLI